MGLFDRLSQLLRSNINDLISRAEDPEKMLTQILVDMRSQLAKAKQKTTDGLVAAMVAPAKAALAKAVAGGRLTQQRADAILARLTARVEALVERVPPKKK